MHTGGESIIFPITFYIVILGLCVLLCVMALNCPYNVELQIPF